MIDFALSHTAGAVSGVTRNCRIAGFIRRAKPVHTMIRNRAVIDCHRQTRDIFGAGFQFEGARDDCLCRRRFPGRRSPKPYVYFLALYLSRIQSVGPWKRQGPAIGLKGGVAPVALVLHFKDLAPKLDLCVNSVYRIAKTGYIAGRVGPVKSATEIGMTRLNHPDG